MTVAEALRIGIAGLGTVGAGVVRPLQENRALIARRAGRPMEIVAVNARDRRRDRGVDLSRYRWAEGCRRAGGGGRWRCRRRADGRRGRGRPLSRARAALEAGKGFVTANKAMVAHHGGDLAALAEAAGVPLKYEAAVAGGIPVIKALGGGAAANEIESLFGILNGTCNYILTAMEAAGAPFADMLAEAQALGYAEADPRLRHRRHRRGAQARHPRQPRLRHHARFRIGGDARDPRNRKRSTSNAPPRSATASAWWGRRGLADGRLFQRVHPVLVPAAHPLAKVTGSLNAVVANGNFVGQLTFEGAGAGAGPTASAVVADLIDIARGECAPVFGVPAAALKEARAGDHEDGRGRSYLRVRVADEPGVLADLTAILRDCGVSIESLIQRGGEERGAAHDDVFIVIITHETEHRRTAEAVRQMAALASVLGAPTRMDLLE